MLLACCLPVVKTLYYHCETQSAVLSPALDLFVGRRRSFNLTVQCKSDDSQIYPLVSATIFRQLVTFHTVFPLKVPEPDFETFLYKHLYNGTVQT